MVSGEAVLLIIITLVNLSLWAVFFTRLKRTFSPQVLLADIKNEVEKLLIEINKTADEDITLIEARITGLKSLIEEADKRLLLAHGQEKGKKREKELLQRLSNSKEKKVAQAYQNMSSNEQKDTRLNTAQLSIEFEPVRSVDNVDIQFKDIPTINEVEESPIKSISFKQRVLQYAAQGFTSDYIASQLGCSETEAQLIIDLYRD